MVAARTGELPLDQLRAAQSARDYVYEKLRVLSERFDATMRAMLAKAAGPHKPR